MAKPPTLGEQLAAIRRKRRYSRPRAVRRSGNALTTNGLYRIETGSRTDPKASTLIGLAEAYNIRFIIDPDGMAIEELGEE